MKSTRLEQWLYLLACSLVLLRTEGFHAETIIIQNPVVKGAVCLDGSPPAYNLHRGVGSGANSWLVQMEGGGWCNNVTSCLARKRTRLGSSTQMAKDLAFSGIMSPKEQFNPDFYNWNRVKIRYCDGSSFTGDVEAIDPATNLHFRGSRIFRAVIAELLAQGMKNADNAIISGCSAGGLTSMLHCDTFRSLLPAKTKVKCVSDAGYFIHTKDIAGGQTIESYFNDIVTTHGSIKNLPISCTSRMKPSLCFFPQYFAKQIQTPLFIINAAYDSWQIKNILAPIGADPQGLWDKCKSNVENCSPTQIQTMQGFRLEFLNALKMATDNASSPRGMYINSCYSHCQIETQHTWYMNNSPKLKNKSIAAVVGDWFYDRSPFQEIDCPYPCDKTCVNRL